MANPENNLTEDQQNDLDHLVSLISSILDTGTFEDDDAVAEDFSAFVFVLTNVISSSPDSSGTQKPD